MNLDGGCVDNTINVNEEIAITELNGRKRRYYYSKGLVHYFQKITTYDTILHCSIHVTFYVIAFPFLNPTIDL